jgi:hypothetical protein
MFEKDATISNNLIDFEEFTSVIFKYINTDKEFEI